MKNSNTREISATPRRIAVAAAILATVMALFQWLPRFPASASPVDAARSEFLNTQQKYVEILRTFGSADERSEAAKRIYLLALERYEEAKKAVSGQSAPVQAAPPAVQTRAAGSGIAALIAAEMASGPLPPPPGVPAIVTPPPISRDILLKYRYGTVDVSALNLRSGPGLSQGVTKVLPGGTRFGIEDYKSGWYRIRLSDGTSGWVAGWLVTTWDKLPPETQTGSGQGGPSGATGLAGRFIESGRVTSNYGYRSDPFTKAKSFHSGIDIGAPRGTPALSLGSGRVVFADWSGGYGRLVKIRYDNGYEAYYAHLDDFAGVKVGDRVNRGDQVGSVDSSGRSTGNHLHFELRDSSGKTLDPKKVDGLVI